MKRQPYLLQIHQEIKKQHKMLKNAWWAAKMLISSLWWAVMLPKLRTTGLEPNLDLKCSFLCIQIGVFKSSCDTL